MLPAIDAAGAWTAEGVRVTLIDGNAFLYYSGMVPEYLGGVYTRDEVRINLDALCQRAGIRFVDRPAVHLDPERRTVTTADGATYSYDVAALDVGAQNPGPPQHAVRTKPLYHIETVEEQLRTTLNEEQQHLSLVVAGGGAAGVEIALNITGRFAAHGRSNALALTLVEGADRLLPAFPSGMSAYVTRQLEDRGARIACDTRVHEVAQGGVVLDDGRELNADLVLWSTGSVGPELFEDAGLVCDDRGFARVTNTLQCMGFPRLFAAGDCATVAGHESLDKVGVHAVKQGPVLRTNLDTALRAVRAGRPPHTWSLDPFAPYPVAPLILSTGRRDGVWTAGPLWLHGRPILRLKHWVDRRWIRRYNPHWHDADWRHLARADAALAPSA